MFSFSITKTVSIFYILKPKKAGNRGRKKVQKNGSLYMFWVFWLYTMVIVVVLFCFIYCWHVGTLLF